MSSSADDMLLAIFQFLGDAGVLRTLLQFKGIDPTSIQVLTEPPEIIVSFTYKEYGIPKLLHFTGQDLCAAIQHILSSPQNGLSVPEHPAEGNKP